MKKMIFSFVVSSVMIVSGARAMENVGKQEVEISAPVKQKPAAPAPKSVSSAGVKASVKSTLTSCAGGVTAACDKLPDMETCKKFVVHNHYFHGTVGVVIGAYIMYKVYGWYNKENKKTSTCGDEDVCNANQSRVY